MGQVSQNTSSKVSASFAEVKTELEKVLAEIRQRKISAFRLAIIGIRAKRVRRDSDTLLSSAFDILNEMLKSLACVDDDIDAFLDTVNGIIDLDKICMEMDVGVPGLHFHRPATVSNAATKHMAQRYGHPVVPSRFLQQQAGARVKPLVEPDTVVAEDIPASAMWLCCLLTAANYNQLYSLVLAGDIPNKYPQPELIPLMQELLKVESPTGWSIAHISAEKGKLSDEWLARVGDHICGASPIQTVRMTHEACNVCSASDFKTGEDVVEQDEHSASERLVHGQ